MPTGWWGIASRVAALMLFDRNSDRALRLRSYAAHAWARRRHSTWVAAAILSGASTGSSSGNGSSLATASAATSCLRHFSSGET